MAARRVDKRMYIGVELRLDTPDVGLNVGHRDPCEGPSSPRKR
jgi:hypothetical protein